MKGYKKGKTKGMKKVHKLSKSCGGKRKGKK